MSSNSHHTHTRTHNNSNGDDDDDSSTVEHEVIFLEDDDEDEESVVRSTPPPRSTRSDGRSNASPLSRFDPLRDFRPMDDAVDPEASWIAASSLETFLTVEERGEGAHRQHANKLPLATSRRSLGSSDTNQHPWPTATTTAASSFSSYPTTVARAVQMVHPTTTRSPGTPQFQQQQQQQPQTSLLDGLMAEDDEEEENLVEMELVQPSRLEGVYGAAGYLEMEDDPSVVGSATSTTPTRLPQHHPDYHHHYEQPIQTASGLLLTHRRPVVVSQSQPQPQHRSTSSSSRQYQSPTPTGRRPLSSLSWEDPPIAYASSAAMGTASKYPRQSHPYYSHNITNNNISSLAGASYYYSTPRFLRYVRWWVSCSALLIVLGTIVLVHHTRQHTAAATSNNNSATTLAQEEGVQAVVLASSPEQQQTNNKSQSNAAANQDWTGAADKIVLLPLPTLLDSPDQRVGNQGLVNVRRAPPANNQRNEPQQRHRRLAGEPQHDITVEARRQQQQPPALGMMHLPETIAAITPGHHHNNQHHKNNNMHDYLREEFQTWMQKHNKKYHSHAERDKRFHIWSENHHRTKRKNEQHGPCRRTGRTVFGSNHLQDLTTDEFREQYLNAATLPRPAHPLGYQSPPPLSSEQSPHRPRRRHATVQERYRQHVLMNNNKEQQEHRTLSRSGSQRCTWYDVSCHLRYIFETYFYGFGRTMEPAYDANSYPTAVDWRDIGALTEVHSQGSCGACWAITAVETVESVHFIATGQLYDLSETEVIACQDECEMCAGGWPQEAFDYIIDHGGLPLEKNVPYDSDFLLMLSDAVAGTSDQLDSSTVKAYQQQTCPSGGSKGGNSKESQDSKDDNNNNADAYSSSVNNYQRYGKISGYGYSTSKCVCYTDGSGCDCANQNEGMAVRNLATYGPAVVCLDASTWQDYTDGILSSDSGCSSGFMDVNHCVQAVGYAYFSDDEENDEHNQEQHSGDNKSGDGGSGDRSKRTGYWIVRNQWSSYWGMSGFAYISMGENTCGILNDMVQAYV